MLKDNETSSIGTFIGDGAYCKMSVHSTAHQRAIKTVITPPTLTFGYHCLGLPAFKDFNESISYMKRHDDKKKGLKLWKKDTGYYRRLRIELILPVLSGLLADILLPNAILKSKLR